MPRSSAEHLNCVWPAGVAGVEAWSSRWSAEPTLPHAHDQWQVSLTRSGVGTVRRRGGTEICRAGAVVVLAPGELHTLAPADPGEVPWIFDTLFVESGTVQAAEVSASEPQGRATIAARFTALHRRVVDQAERLDQESFLQEFLSSLRSDDENVRVSETPLRDSQHVALRRVRDYLEARPSRAVTLAELAALAELGEFRLVRSFRRAFGLPPYAYHLQVRINRARGLLRSGVPVAEVAHRTGFADQAHLTRHFRKLVGITPGLYRAAQSSKMRPHPSRPVSRVAP